MVCLICTSYLASLPMQKQKSRTEIVEEFEIFDLELNKILKLLPITVTQCPQKGCLYPQTCFLIAALLCAPPKAPALIQSKVWKTTRSNTFLDWFSRKNTLTESPLDLSLRVKKRNSQHGAVYPSQNLLLLNFLFFPFFTWARINPASSLMRMLFPYSGLNISCKEGLF